MNTKNAITSRVNVHSTWRTMTTRLASRPPMLMSVRRSNRGIFARLVDDEAGRTVAAAQWTESDVKSLKPMEQASKVGALLAERAKAAGVERAVFDRGGYSYHGRVKALAEGAREGGLAI